MSLVGFDHVFSRASLFPFAQDVQYKVAPPSVIALLKTVSYMDDPHGRQKDLTDLKALFRRYEEASERIFGDALTRMPMPGVWDSARGRDIPEAGATAHPALIVVQSETPLPL